MGTVRSGIHVSIIKGTESYDKYPAFLYRLNKMYNGEFFRQKLGDPESYCVRWFMQESTFSYEIFKHKNAFLGKPEYQSQVFWHSNNDLNDIVRDIYSNVKKLKYGK